MVEKVGDQRRRPQQERSRDTRERILTAATQLFAEHGVGNVSTNRIAAHAGMSIGSLYRYFADKDAILETLRLRLVGELEEQFTAAVLAGMALAPAESFARSLHGIADTLARRRELVRALSPHATLEALGLGDLERRLLILTRGYLLNLLGPLPDAELEVKAYVMVSVGVASSLRIGLEAPSHLDRDAVIAEIARMVAGWLEP
ncbi:helix-turn-helix domain-containing protein [Nocardia sp. NPDC050697]|uniref:TetR/AcrR family transcriptional regulator n=1 Tax=Nocardia sp. NPDC050697 TaxID=3155158 RepID=UPI0033E46AB8